MITLRGAMLTARYTARAVYECAANGGTLRALRHSVAEQIRVASATIEMFDTLDRFCCCADSLAPLEYVQCPTCEMKRSLMFVALRPGAHTTEHHDFALELVSNTLRRQGYLT